jgi:hypothetical protein
MESGEPAVCCICGQTIRFDQVRDGTRDFVSVVLSATGDAVHCHTDCMPGDDLSVAPAEFPGPGDIPIGVLAVLYEDEGTAKLRFADFSDAASRGALRVSLISREGGSLCALIISTKEGHNVNVPTMDPRTIDVIRRSLNRHKSFLLVGGRIVPGGFEPFDDCMVVCEECAFSSV